ncbi:hypothetical protein O181_009174 [Austropuccinia psidii MF-1]|uniref:DUF202 domain-containing protein n=1 Tax=Austropuccinia psidii MF-1 TaxID=1389203 RepID=A0A9Q3BQB1_9BASI|nr:hypothetical protein [Austropuccinia psidii MF-1]
MARFSRAPRFERRSRLRRPSETCLRPWLLDTPILRHRSQQSLRKASRKNCTTSSKTMIGRLLSSSRIANEGSTARDHCSQDRNWMQWIRLSCMMMLISVVLKCQVKASKDSDENLNRTPKYLLVKKFETVLAAFCAALSILIPVIALIDYLMIQGSMSKKRGFPQSSGFSRAMVISVLVITILLCLILFFGQQ